MFEESEAQAATRLKEMGGVSITITSCGKFWEVGASMKGLSLNRSIKNHGLLWAESLESENEGTKFSGSAVGDKAHWQSRGGVDLWVSEATIIV